MKKLLLLTFLVLAGAANAFGQSTTVSGQVTDAGGQTWNNGTCQFQFVPNQQFPTSTYTWTGGALNRTISCTLNGTGAYSQSVPSNTAISPGGSKWILQVTPNATYPSFSTNATTIFGGTQTVNVTPPAISISAIPGSYAYADAEISGATTGSLYFNVTSSTLRAWNGSAWMNVGGAGSGTVTSFSSGNLSPLFTTSVATPTTTPALSFTLSNAGAGTVYGNPTGAAAAPSFTAAPVLGLPGTTIGTLGFGGNTSGTATITPQATAGTPTLTLPNASGTFAVNASSPLVLDAGTGNLTCPTCGTGSGTVTSVSFTGGLISVATPTTTPALTVAGTSGGIPFFSGAATWASSGVLAANQLVLGGGAGTTPATLGSLGTTTTLLHGNAAGAPTFGAVNLAADVTGQLPIGNVGSAGLSGTSPIAIASTGAISCSTCVVASSPGVGIAHFAGSTQTVTSSAVNLAGADVTGQLPIGNVGSAGLSGTSPMAISAAGAISITANGITSTQLAAQYSKWLACDGKGLGDGLNAIPAGTYLQSTCKNITGVTVTITGIQCLTDNNGTSTLNAAGNTLGALLTGAVTCTTSYAAGTQSANVALTSNDFIKFTFVADGTSKQTDWVVTGTY